MRKTTGSVPGVSAARTANPSIALLGNGGRSTTAARSLGEHAPGRLLERNPLRRQRLDALENEALGLLESQKLGHDRRIPYARRIGSAAVISVVVPVHDEERTVALLYDELESALQPLGQPWEAVFVDDGSTDGSFAALTRLHSAQDNVRVIRLRKNFGKAAALAAGFAHAEGDVVVTIDADLQDDPAEIPRLLAKLDEGFDLVSGWKTHRRDPLTRRVPSKIFNWVTGRVSGLRLHDLNCGLKAYRAEVVQGLRALRRAAPLHPGARALPRPPRRRAAGQPPPARARPLALRGRAVRPRLPRPAHGLVHRALPLPAAAPVRRARPRPRRDRLRACSST